MSCVPSLNRCVYCAILVLMLYFNDFFCNFLTMFQSKPYFIMLSVLTTKNLHLNVLANENAIKTKFMKDSKYLFS